MVLVWRFYRRGKRERHAWGRPSPNGERADESEFTLHLGQETNTKAEMRTKG